MAKCKGSKEDGSVCGRPTMYKSDYCKNHRDQDSSVILCMGKSPAGKPCSRLALEGLLFCRQHRVQIANLEKLQCPRGCGLLSYKWIDNKGGYYVCKECSGSALDAKSMETRLSDHVEGLNELLEGGEECSTNELVEKVISRLTSVQRGSSSSSHHMSVHAPTAPNIF